MRKLIISLLAGITCLLAANIATAVPANITASHQILSIQPTAVGTDITINLTLSNLSANDISNAAVDIADSVWQLNASDPGTRKGDFIGASASISYVWVLHTNLPSFSANMPLTLNMFYADVNGNPVSETVTSAAR